MLRKALTRVAVALVLGLAGTVAVSAASQASQPASANSRTLTFDVVFSPFSLAATNNERDPSSPFALGDEITFHDLLFDHGTQVGDDVGSCVIVATGTDVLGNCSLVIRLPGGTIAGQFATSPGPAPKSLALTGGTGTYRAVGGEATLVEFGTNNAGSLTLHVLSLAPRGDGT